MVERPSRDLLRRHVGRSSHHHAGLGVASRGHGCAVRRLATHVLCQPEIQNLDPAFIRHHHIRGLQVAVHDAFLVSRGERLRNRAGNFDDPV